MGRVSTSFWRRSPENKILRKCSLSEQYWDYPSRASINKKKESEVTKWPLRELLAGFR